MYEDVAIATYLLVSFLQNAFLIHSILVSFLFICGVFCFFCRSYGKCNGKSKRVKHSKALLTSDVEMVCLFIFSSQKGWVGIYNIFSGYMLTWVRFKYFLRVVSIRNSLICFVICNSILVLDWMLGKEAFGICMVKKQN